MCVSLKLRLNQLVCAAMSSESLLNRKNQQLNPARLSTRTLNLLASSHYTNGAHSPTTATLTRHYRQLNSALEPRISGCPTTTPSGQHSPDTVGGALELRERVHGARLLLLAAAAHLRANLLGLLGPDQRLFLRRFHTPHHYRRLEFGDLDELLFIFLI